MYFDASGAQWQQTALAGTEIGDGLVGMECAFDFGEGDAVHLINLLY